MLERSPDRMVRATVFRDGVGVSPVLKKGYEYQAGDVLGGKLILGYSTRFQGGSGAIETVCVTDRTNQRPDLDLIVFGHDPMTSAFDDGQPARVSDADMIRVAGGIQVRKEHWIDLVDNALATIAGVDLGYVVSHHELFGLLICRVKFRATDTNDLYLQLTVRQD